jgi:ankyrin repeat protein
MGKNHSRKRSRGGQVRPQQQPQEQEQQHDNPAVSVDEEGVVLTPLISAIRDSRDDSRELNFPKPGAIARITELLNQGADINGTDSIGRTPLMHAVIVGVPEVFYLISDRGADVNAQDNEGRSALMWAATPSNVNKYDLAEYLLEEPGIIVNSVNKQGQSAMDIDEEGPIRRLIERHVNSTRGGRKTKKAKKTKKTKKTRKNKKTTKRRRQ